MIHSYFIKILIDVQKGTFLETMQRNERIDELSKLPIQYKQRIIFAVAVQHQNEPKKAEEIFTRIRAALTNNTFFELPHYDENEELLKRLSEVLVPTALHYAAQKCGKNVIGIIVKQGIDVNRLELSKNKFNTALDITIEHGNEAGFEALLASGARINPEGNATERRKAAVLQVLDYFREAHDKAQYKEKLIRMVQKLITAGADPNVWSSCDTHNGYVRQPAFMQALMQKDLFNADLVKQFLSSPKLDLSCKWHDWFSQTRIIIQDKTGTALDFVTSESEDKQSREACELLKGHIRNQFAIRLVLIEKTIVACAELPPGVANICAQYAFAPDNYDNYGSTERSLSFLFNISSDPEFNESVRDYRKKASKVTRI